MSEKIMLVLSLIIKTTSPEKWKTEKAKIKAMILDLFSTPEVKKFFDSLPKNCTLFDITKIMIDSVKELAEFRVSDEVLKNLCNQVQSGRVDL